MAFQGFPSNVRATAVPDPFFNSLLAEIEDAAELKVTLRAFWLLGQQRGPLRALAEAELLNDPTLLQGVKFLGGNPQEQVRRGLVLATARQTLLRVPAAGPEGCRYLLNTAANRRQLARQGAAGDKPESDNRAQFDPEESAATPEPAGGNRPNIYALYEDNIGLIGPQMAAYLQEAEASYPESWIAAAFDIAIRENKRSWNYIAAILRRWAAEGKIDLAKAGGGGPAAVEPPGVGVKAGAALWPGERIEHGKPGGHSAADRRPRYPEDYQRR